MTVLPSAIGRTWRPRPHRAVDIEPGQKACIQLVIGRSQGLVCSDKTNIRDVGEALDAAMKNPQGIPQ